MKIIFVGAHGTGKSTLMNKLNEELELPVVESVSRECQTIAKKMGWEPYGKDQSNYQLMTTEFAFWDYNRINNWGIDCILARCPIDVVAYMKSNNDERYEEYMEELRKMKAAKMFDDCVFFYIPIEFPLVDDNCRPMDPEYQKLVDKNMRDILYDLGIKSTPVFGSVEERAEQCMTVIDDYDMSSPTAQNIKNQVLGWFKDLGLPWGEA